MRKRVLLPILPIVLSGAIPSTAAPPSAGERQAIVQLLERATFGPTEALITEIIEKGREAWLAEQLDPDSIEDPGVEQRLAIYPTLGQSIDELLANYPPELMNDPVNGPARIGRELRSALMIRAVHGRAQLREVLVDFWFNHFNVFAPESPTLWSILPYVRDVIRPHVLGRFEDLLRATAQSAAMLYYLDNYVSVAEGSRGSASGINENYARELMELHTLGVDGGYTQDDVLAVARALTGWTFTPPRTGTLTFMYIPRFHDSEPKTLLGEPLESSGIEEGFEVLHRLATHPSTARFTATKLAARFVDDDPPAGLVDRAAETFERTEGDLRAVTEVILTSPEIQESAYRDSKVRSPLEIAAASLRVVGADVRDGLMASRIPHFLGQPLLAAPPPTGWSERAEDVTSAGDMLNRFQVAWVIASGEIEGAEIDAQQWARILDRPRGLHRLIRTVLNGPAGPDTRMALREAADAGADPRLLAALLLASPEFQRQ